MSNLRSTIEKLNEICIKALENAGKICIAHTHYDIEIEHLLLKLLEIENSDLHNILRYFGINESKLQTDLTSALNEFKTGNKGKYSFSLRLENLLDGAWIIASIKQQLTTIRSGHLILALLNNKDLNQLIKKTSDVFYRISLDELLNKFNKIISNSIESQSNIDDYINEDISETKIHNDNENSLDQYTVNLTEKAAKGELDPIFGRDTEIKRMIDVLIRKRKNNPILVGEAGVGKTAIVEGFALRINKGDVPSSLINAEIRVLDIGLLQAGTGVKGEFEKRLKSIIDDVKKSISPIIIFIDEAHMLVGAGGPQGMGDAANILKPSLARGELRTIAATTWAEYKKYFDDDSALSRRFEPIKIEEPDEEKALVMMRGIAPYYEKHHKVIIREKALLEAVRLSKRYITGRYLPDKAVSVIDTACANVALGMEITPTPIESLSRRISNIDMEIKSLNREILMGNDQTEQIKHLEILKNKTRLELDELNSQRQKESKIVKQIREILKKIYDVNENDKKSIDNNNIEIDIQKIKTLEIELKQIQGEKPLINVSVDQHSISNVISGWTGIPTGRMFSNEIEKILHLKEELSKRIIAQEYAVEFVTDMINISKAGAEDPSKPMAVLLLAGPSGVGKTETALALSDLLFGGENNMVSINMSEYREPHRISELKGAPAGYVGYKEGGILSEAVRKRPYCVVLLDEIDKAHADVKDFFYNIFENGILTDGTGKTVDFKNTMIILTSNVGSEIIMKHCKDEETMPNPKALTEMLEKEFKRKNFTPAFLGRLQIIPYYPISMKNLKRIVKIKLDNVAIRLKENKKINFEYSEDLIENISNRCTEVDSGARNIDHILNKNLLPKMSKEILNHMMNKIQVENINVNIVDKKFNFLIT